MEDRFAEDVYFTLIGEMSPPYALPGVENAYADGSECDELWNSVCDAYDRLRSRLHIADEDPDVETIIGSLLSIQHTLCIKMFQYGAMYDRCMQDN